MPNLSVLDTSDGSLHRDLTETEVARLLNITLDTVQARVLTFGEVYDDRYLAMTTDRQLYYAVGGHCAETRH